MTEKEPTSSNALSAEASALSAVPKPDLASLLLESPLYAKMAFDPERDAVWTHRVVYSPQQVDAYCVHCRRDLPFASKPSYTPAFSKAYSGFCSLEFSCLRNKKHSYIYYLKFEDSSVQKVGQYPSIEDIVGSELSKYREVLPGADFSELRRASGLAAHGIGIGSFVYLRRIFERLIEEHRINHEICHGKIDDYNKMRMDERIQALSSTLPDSLVRNRIAYGILSKGMHELTEDECRMYFPVVKDTLIRILEDDLQRKLRQKSEADLEQKIQAIHAEISRKGNRVSGG